jgi:F-type H+-transporting ATPase subunit epsilon
MSIQPLRLVVVTPETTLLDEPVEALRFPLADGSIGILPGRAPLVGRLGVGELRITTNGQEQRFFIEGGFVQVNAGVVSLLTERAIRPDQINAQQVRQHLEQLSHKVTHSDVEYAAKQQEQERDRRMLAMLDAAPGH